MLHINAVFKLCFLYVNVVQRLLSFEKLQELWREKLMSRSALNIFGCGAWTHAWGEGKEAGESPLICSGLASVGGLSFRELAHNLEKGQKVEHSDSEWRAGLMRERRGVGSENKGESVGMNGKEAQTITDIWYSRNDVKRGEQECL
jgi:hypothetical protein